MPLDSKYKPGDIRTLLNLYTQKGVLQSTREHVGLGGAQMASPYQHPQSQVIILDPATDKVNNKLQTLQTIKQAFDQLSPTNGNSKERVVIIPVAEEQKILGLFPRDHWVTLHYDPKQNKATIIDSRPWYVSIFYPTSAMKQLLKAGIAAVYGKEQLKLLSFKKIYQGVQHNDTHCGAWTIQNIIDLAGNSDASAVAKQWSKYKSKDELSVVNSMIKLAGELMNPLISGSATPNQDGSFLDNEGITEADEMIIKAKPSFLRRLISWIGFKNKSHQDQPAITSPDKIKKGLGPASSNATHGCDEDGDYEVIARPLTNQNEKTESPGAKQDQDPGAEDSPKGFKY